MHIRVLAVGDRQPAWVDDAVKSYATRLPREWRFRLDMLAGARRSKSSAAGRAVEDEGARLIERIGPREQVVLLDERGRAMTSPKLADRLAGWQADGRDLCFIIGGADGVAATVRERADFCWSLSPLTLPHGLARVLLLEQLYRAWSLSTHHPYHRE